MVLIFGTKKTLAMGRKRFYWLGSKETSQIGGVNALKVLLEKD